jgi:hypothetical protein
MCSWYVLITVAIAGAMATMVFNRYLAISSGMPIAASNLISAVNVTLGWSTDPGSNIGTDRKDVPAEVFGAFLSNTWPWQRKKLLSIWNSYNTSKEDQKAKAAILKDLLNLTKHYSGFA